MGSQPVLPSGGRLRLGIGASQGCWSAFAGVPAAAINESDPIPVLLRYFHGI